MRSYLIVCAALLCASATGAVTLDGSSPPPPVTKDNPVSVGIPHTCAQYYPAAAIRESAEGTTTLAFQITVQGKTTDITVAKSSGNKDLDDASVNCATHWLYKPAIRSNKPIEVPWVANVVWKMGLPPAASHAMQCLRYREDTSPIPPNIGITSIAFQVRQDGTVGDVKVTHSSGDSSFDDAAVRCALATHYDVSVLTLPDGGLPGHADLDWSAIPPPPTIAKPASAGSDGI